MTRTLPIVEARRQLTSLPETLVRDNQIDVMAITRRGKPVLAVMPWELYESITETLEVTADQALMEQLRQSLAEIEKGAGIPWEEAQLELRK